MNFSPCLILILILNSYHLTLGRPPQWMWGPAFPPPARWPSTRQHTPLHPLTRPEAVEGAKPYFAQAGVLVAAGTHAPCTRVSRQGDRNPRPLGAPPYKGPCIHQGGMDPQGGNSCPICTHLIPLFYSNGLLQSYLLPLDLWGVDPPSGCGGMNPHGGNSCPILYSVCLSTFAAVLIFIHITYVPIICASEYNLNQNQINVFIWSMLD